MHTTRVLEEASGPSRLLGNFYNFLLRHRQDWVKYYFHFLNQSRLNQSRLFFQLAQGYGQRLLQQVRPNIIVSVHPMTHHFYAYLLRQLGWIEQVPLVSVVTDPCYGFWRGWACAEIRRYYVASEAAKRQLLDYGVAAARIQIAGLPIRQQFQPVSREKQRRLRLSLGLEPDKFTVLVNAGWIGGGNIPKILRSLLRAQALAIQIVFLAGRNQTLKQEALQLAQQSAIPLIVVGFTRDIHELMQLADVMVSKVGGLTSFEALACELPILADAVTAPMPQEAGIAQWLQESGSSILLKQPEEIVPIVERFLRSPECLQTLKQASRTHSPRGAATRIAGDILSLC